MLLNLPPFWPLSGKILLTQLTRAFFGTRACVLLIQHGRLEKQRMPCNALQFLPKLWNCNLIVLIKLQDANVFVIKQYQHRRITESSQPWVYDTDNFGQISSNGRHNSQVTRFEKHPIQEQKIQIFFVAKFQHNLSLYPRCSSVWYSLTKSDYNTEVYSISTLFSILDELGANIVSIFYEVGKELEFSKLSQELSGSRNYTKVDVLGYRVLPKSSSDAASNIGKYDQNDTIRDKFYFSL